MNDITLKDLHPIFTDCCAKENTRYAIARPWVSGGFVYATDGIICVRQPSDGPDSPQPDGATWPPAGDVYDVYGDMETSRIIQIPPLELEASECTDKCEACRGRKYISFDTHGRGAITCEQCDGLGTYTWQQWPVIKFGHLMFFNGRYISILLNHGIVAFRVGFSPRHVGPAIGRFKLDVIEGVLAGMAGSAEPDIDLTELKVVL